eukprot:scaffold639_cov304-Pinguiococcus_pyrenoidosus.AAC.10
MVGLASTSGPSSSKRSDVDDGRMADCACASIGITQDRVFAGTRQPAQLSQGPLIRHEFTVRVRNRHVLDDDALERVLQQPDHAR